MGKRKRQSLQHMDCKELFALLSQYIDGELPADACAELEKHLGDCSPCVAFLNTLRKTAELCRRYQPSELPRPLEARLRRELRAAYQAALRKRRGGQASRKDRRPSH